jgi:alpha-glucosidase (family GH31 glycosyl hydrolase)
MYLPAGTWYDYHSNTKYTGSTGQWVNNVPLWVNGAFQLPAYAKAAAIIPKMFVDDKTMNVMGKRTDGSTHNELITRVYSDPTSSSFTLAEDDGSPPGTRAAASR